MQEAIDVTFEFYIIPSRRQFFLKSRAVKANGNWLRRTGRAWVVRSARREKLKIIDRMIGSLTSNRDGGVDY